MDAASLKNANANTLAKEFQWLSQVIDTRMNFILIIQANMRLFMM